MTCGGILALSFIMEKQASSMLSKNIRNVHWKVVVAKAPSYKGLLSDA